MKVTIVDKNYKGQDSSLVYSIILLVLGIFLTFNANGVLNIVFDILGSLVMIYGVYKLVMALKLKKNFKTVNDSLMSSSIMSLVFGLLIIVLSQVLINAINVVTGMWLIFMGISKLNVALSICSIKEKDFIVSLISSILIIGLGLYTIMSQNVVLTIIGILLIIYSVIDIINYIVRNN